MCKNSPMFDWEDLRSFSALARTGSLSAAARELGVDHATVSRRVAMLQRDLGMRLIDRLPRSVSLTPDGVAIAELAGTMTDTAYAVARRARGADGGATASVRVSAPPAVASCLIAPHVSEFHDKNPDILLVLSGHATMAALDRREADLAVRMARPEEPDLIARRIGAVQFGLYASSGHAALPPSERSFVAYDAPLDHVAQQVWLRSILNGRSIVFQASDLFSLQAAARSGVGAVVLPRFLGDGDEALVSLPVETPPPVRELWLVTYPDLSKSPAIRAVMGFVVDVIGRECQIAKDRAAAH